VARRRFYFGANAKSLKREQNNILMRHATSCLPIGFQRTTESG